MIVVQSKPRASRVPVRT